MKLLNDFFNIVSSDKAGEKFNVAVTLNPAHEIFKGHFPGNPVVPGVCMIQMLKEVLEHIHHHRFTLKEASQLKFLAVLNPEKVKHLNIEINILKNDENGMHVSGSFYKDDLVFMKFKGTFTGEG